MQLTSLLNQVFQSTDRKIKEIHIQLTAWPTRLANGAVPRRKDREVTRTWVSPLQLRFLILLQATQKSDFRASSVAAPRLRGTTLPSAHLVPLALSVSEVMSALSCGTDGVCREISHSE